MMSETKQFARVERPARANQRSRRSSLLMTALVDTLTTGDAVAVPINGDSPNAVRNRVAIAGHRLAKRHNARYRTTRSDDSAAILVWLEPKAEGAK